MENLSDSQDAFQSHDLKNKTKDWKLCSFSHSAVFKISFQKESPTSSGSAEKTPAHWSLLLFLELLWFSLSGLHGRNASRQPIYSNVIVFHVRAKQRFWSAQAGRCWQPIEWMEWRTWLTTGFRKTSTGPTRGTEAYRSWSWPISQEGPSYATSTTPGPLWSIHWSGKTTITVGNITFSGVKGFVCFCESNRAPRHVYPFKHFVKLSPIKQAFI